jgi:hypothetical protein
MVWFSPCFIAFVFSARNMRKLYFLAVNVHNLFFFVRLYFFKFVFFAYNTMEYIPKLKRTKKKKKEKKEEKKKNRLWIGYE